MADQVYKGVIFDFNGVLLWDKELQEAAWKGLDPKDCIVTEDAKSGIAAAHAAGIGKIIALGSKEKHEELSQLPGINEVITSLTELDPKELFGEDLRI